MTESILFSRSKLSTFLACQRRFQLRFLRQLPWPTKPASQRAEVAQRRGQRFHQLLERHFSGLPVSTQSIADEVLRRWWRIFQTSDLALPDGRLHPESGLTVPIGGHFLTGRFDLLIVGEKSGVSFAHVFDWKTGQAHEEAELRQDWQTRLYCAMLAKGGEAFLRDARPPDPDNIAITYWYVTEPDAPRTIQYDRSWHAQNWHEIQSLIAQIDQMQPERVWPLTDDWSHCRQCAYQTYCDRREAGTEVRELAEEEMLWDENSLLMEPDPP